MDACCTTITVPTGPPGASSPSIYIGQHNIVVSTQGDDSSGQVGGLTFHYLTITNAIVAATGLVPSPSNMINILVYPGTYTENFTVPQYVNLIAITPNELIYDGFGYTSIALKSGGTLRPVYINGTITTASDNVKIIGFNCITFACNHLSTNSYFAHIVAGTSITSSSATINGTWFDVHSYLFLSGNKTLSGYFKNCTGDDFSFAGSNAGISGIISGVMEECIGNIFCYAGSSLTPGTISGTLINIKTNDTAGINSAITGVIRNTRISQTTGTQAAAIRVGASAKVEYCTFKGTTNAITASVPVGADINFCKLIPNVSGNGLSANITNLTTTPYVTDESTSIF